MTYSITYQKGNEVHHLEWIAPTDWSTNAVCESFARQFPQAELIDIQQRTGQ